jgi:hypothetical protein
MLRHFVQNIYRCAQRENLNCDWSRVAEDFPCSPLHLPKRSDIFAQPIHSLRGSQIPLAFQPRLRG